MKPTRVGLRPGIPNPLGSPPLVSSLIGPMLLFLLILTFGPYVVNRILKYETKVGNYTIYGATEVYSNQALYN